VSIEASDRLYWTGVRAGLGTHADAHAKNCYRHHHHQRSHKAVIDFAEGARRAASMWC